MKNYDTEVKKTIKRISDVIDDKKGEATIGYIVNKLKMRRSNVMRCVQHGIDAGIFQ